MPGEFKLDHLQPFKPILFWKISNFFTFILGSQFYYPRGLIMGKGKFLQLPIWMRLRGFSAWGIQTGQLAALWAPFVLKFFQLFHFHTGEPILITPEANNGKRENLTTPNMDDTNGFQCLGPSNWTICSPLSQFCPEHFPTFSLSYWGAHSYYPRG